jgi:cytoskeletal protein RodZ
MNEKTQKLGELFKLRRAEMNLSLKEIESSTSIRIPYLQAIEEGDFSRLISPIYARGFVQQYARFLGLNGEHILRDYGYLLGYPEKQEFDYGIGTLEPRGSPGAGVKWLPNAMWVGATVLLVLAAWYFARLVGVV